MSALGSPGTYPLFDRSVSRLCASEFHKPARERMDNTKYTIVQNSGL